MASQVRDEIKLLLSRSRDDLEAAQVLLDAGKYRASLSRAYYAVFYAATALLLTQNIRRSKHAGVQGAFGQFFVKPGLIEVQYSDIFKNVREARELSDYDLVFLPAEQLTQTRIAEAGRFVARIETYLTITGWIT